MFLYLKADVLIIGGGDGGLAVFRMVKALRPDWEVVVVKPEVGFCFKCPLPFYIAGEAPAEGVFLRDEEMFKGAHLVYAHAVDASHVSREVRLSSGEVIKFEKAVVIATGSQPYLPKIEGSALENVFTLRSFESANAISNALKTANSAVIVGGGYIATEISEAFVKKEVATHLVVRSRILRGSFDEDFSTTFKVELEKHGVKVHQGRNVVKIAGSKKVEKVVLDDGSEIKADLVVFATGVKPVLEPAMKLGTAIGQLGILVDDRMETSLKGVYAVGEVAETKNLVSGKPTTCKTAATAMAQGAVAGYNIAGYAITYPGDADCLISKLFNLHIGKAGLTTEEALSSGFNPISKVVKYRDHYTSLPGGNEFTAKVIFDMNTGMLIGCQFIGQANVSDKVEAAALALRFKARITDLVSYSSASFPASTFNPRFNQFREPAQQVFKELLDIFKKA
ncbi:MAG: hypothetical protein DRJ33_07745 [Candidatus Methanomethylicota archaeon]|uniref:FAD/NAD(P)-binding domain-containing protein n=1 Tax=Thermoproteota archaeon TaxID=2056631 RepID=A0A497ERR1_9CREN|nr:MAG: hypothetical protein DRJ33_07745 [Candidatus Verstraetearchaeota archaeon]